VKAYGEKEALGEKTEDYHFCHIACYVCCQNISDVEDKNQLQRYIKLDVFTAVKVWFEVEYGRWLQMFRWKILRDMLLVSQYMRGHRVPQFKFKKFEKFRSTSTVSALQNYYCSLATKLQTAEVGKQERFLCT
jgi:hypothetical protein